MALRFLLFAGAIVCVHACYWNAECPYVRYSSKTPYETVRGDIRDAIIPSSCEPVSVWLLNRHGNRNPGDSVTRAVKEIANLKDEIIASYNQGASLLCAQDIQMFKHWTWNSTLETSQSYLTLQGYIELYNIGKRILEKYPHLINGTASEYYIRPTNEQRTITSAIAFVHGLTEDTGLELNIQNAETRDDVIRPYENCDRYQQEVKSGPQLLQALDDYYKTNEFIDIQKSVQLRLGIETVLSADDIYAMYELCRFDRSWNEFHQSPWCAAFTNEDLVVLEYRDDIRHYYRNGYGSWVNERLGQLPLKDLYENMEAYIEGNGKKVVAYFTHDTMLEMVYCALGVYRDDSALKPDVINPNRKWMTSFIGNFAVNLMVVLNKCASSSTDDYKIQFFINEKQLDICPLQGCSWSEFKEKFEHFKYSDLAFCSMDYNHEYADALTNNGYRIQMFFALFVIQIMLMFR